MSEPTIFYLGGFLLGGAALGLTDWPKVKTLRPIPTFLAISIIADQFLVASLTVVTQFKVVPFSTSWSVILSFYLLMDFFTAVACSIAYYYRCMAMCLAGDVNTKRALLGLLLTSIGAKLMNAQG